MISKRTAIKQLKNFVWNLSLTRKASLILRNKAKSEFKCGGKSLRGQAGNNPQIAENISSKAAKMLLERGGCDQWKRTRYINKSRKLRYNHPDRFPLSKF